MKYINATIQNVTITFQSEDVQKVIALLGDMLNKENWFGGWVDKENPSKAKYGFAIKFSDNFRVSEKNNFLTNEVRQSNIEQLLSKYPEDSFAESFINVDFHNLPFYYRKREYSEYIDEIVKYVRNFEQFRNFSRHNTPFHSKDLQLFIRLLNKLALKKDDSSEESAIFSFPKGWIDEPVKIKPFSKTVNKDRDSDIDPIYKEYAVIFKEISKYNLGGSDLMAAAHNSLKRERHKVDILHEPNALKQESITIHNPASFNFQFATGSNTLITNVLKGKIRINKVIVGTQHDWAVRECEKKQGGNR